MLPLAPPAPSVAILLPDPMGDPIGDRAAVRLTDGAGRPVARRSVELRALVPKGAGAYWVAGGGLVRVEPPSALTPLVEDAGTAALRKRWAGRLWAYGGYRFDGSDGTPGRTFLIEVPATEPVRVVGLFRLRTPGARVGLSMPHTNLDGPEAVTDAPVVLVAGMPRGARVGGMSGRGEMPLGMEGGMPLPMRTRMPPARGLRWSATFADGAHLERRFSFAPPAGENLRAARAGEPKPGMRPDAAAWALGWPPLERPLAELRRLPRWEYPMPAPFGFSVEFRGGRVLRYNPPGNLP